MLKKKHGKNLTLQRLVMAVNHCVGLFGYVSVSYFWCNGFTICRFNLLLLQPRIDKDSLEMLSMECPRIVVNPKPSFLTYSLHEVPREALPDVALDEPFVKDIDPETWVVRGVVKIPTTTPSLSLTSSSELSIAEKFRLAFAERDARLAPKRAKNARQQQRRAERDWMMSSDEAKAVVFASKATRSLRKR